MPRYSYYISPHDTLLSPKSAVWHEPLPLTRPTSDVTAETFISHGEYFKAVRSYLEQGDFRLFSEALGRRIRQPVDPGDIQEIQIHLEKHGEFYHPARIVAEVAGHKIYFVLNTAVSDPGKRLISQDFCNLKKLNAEFIEDFLPRVYSIGEVTTGSNVTVCMFLGEWIRDYHEFHISHEIGSDQYRICVWDDKSGRYYLSHEQMLQLYRQAARIMTCYYNLITFEHISSWHHAAGDFIIKLDQNEIDLKLITVRNYVPLLQDQRPQSSATGNVELLLQALLIFFLKLSIWMRLDRIDGIGEIMWLDQAIVKSIVKGVYDGLAQKTANQILPDAVDTCFKIYLSNCSQDDFFELSDSLLQTLPPATPEIPLIRQHLAEHVQSLFRFIKEN